MTPTLWVIWLTTCTVNSLSVDQLPAEPGVLAERAVAIGFETCVVGTSTDVAYETAVECVSVLPAFSAAMLVEPPEGTVEWAFCAPLPDVELPR